MKIENDRYFTPINIANWCWDKVDEVIGEENISDIIEPSCGDGAFYHHHSHVPTYGYEIIPSEELSKASEGYLVFIDDFLKANITYMPGRLVIGNPPYGARMTMAQKFYKKAVTIGDYVAFILPISQLNNSVSLYEFDLISSTDLGIQKYSGRELHCCFNIYRIPETLELNPKPIYKLKDVTITRTGNKGFDEFEHDVRICQWGDGTMGKILKPDEHYAAEFKIKINNEALKDEILNFICTYDWNSNTVGISAKKLQQWQIIKALKENIEGIQ